MATDVGHRDYNTDTRCLLDAGLSETPTVLIFFCRRRKKKKKKEKLWRWQKEFREEGKKGKGKRIDGQLDK